MKNWPADLDRSIIEPGDYCTHFGYDLRQWLDVHPESLLGKAWALVYGWHRSIYDYPEEIAYETIEDHLWCQSGKGISDFDEMQGKILAMVVAARLEGR